LYFDCTLRDNDIIKVKISREKEKDEDNGKDKKKMNGLIIRDSYSILTSSLDSLK